MSRLWYQQPAKEWEEALPLASGEQRKKLVFYLLVRGAA